MALADYQREFAQALLADEAAPASPRLARLVAQPGFAVYRNTVLKGCIDALQANFPAVARLVGDEWLRAAASVYARQQLPTEPTLLTYGATLPEFLAHFEPAADLPYLSDVARVDRLWGEAHVAADDDTLQPEDLATLAPEQMSRAGIRLHAATRWHWCAEHPVATLWQRNRHAAVATAEATGEAIEWCGEGLLLTRPGGAVLHTPLPQEGAALLAAFADGLTFEQAFGAALAINPAADLAALFSQLLQAGALSHLHFLDDQDTPR
jgi:hypothetical protein